ncbi:MAG: hypothetical protein J0L69_12485 [Bacteroidetes bacterium]|nr:hypothetical protein [Bacteroidota bacterium]
MSKQLTGRQRSEARRQIVISNPSVCYYCKSTGLTITDAFCPNCGFPQRGTQVQMKKFIWNINNKHVLLDKQKKAISKARNILFGLSILFFVFSLILGLGVEFNLFILISNLIVSGIYLGLGFWSIKNPFPAILTGFFLYITLIVINAVFDPATLLQGALMKGFVIAGFIYGYKAVKESAALEKELESIKKAKDLNIPDEVSELSN